MTPEQLLNHYDAAHLWPAGCGVDLDEAYRRALAVRDLRIARGERPRGYKVGFTNRGIWPRYNVFAPIWGAVWDSTLAFCEGEAELNLAGTCQPRLEPEAVFCLASSPPPGASMQQLRECIAWVAPGFEVVQSHLPDWKFTAPDTVADGALHARLLVGPRTPAAQLPAQAGDFDAALANARVVLTQDGRVVDQGLGANVLDGPLHALHHFLQALRSCRGAPELAPGEVVTTGTWTDAWPVAAGETWRAAFEPPLAPLQVRFS